MKILILFFISILNLTAWFIGVSSINEIVIYLPLVSILLSIIYLFPQIRTGKIEVKLIYFVIAGILYFNVPLYFKAIFNPSDLLQDLISLGIKNIYFIKANLLLGVSLPLIVAGYLNAKKATFNNINKTFCYKYDSTIPLTLFSILAIIFLVLSVSITGFTIGSTYSADNTPYYYILLKRFIYILGSVFIYKRFIKKENKNNYKQFSSEETFALIVIIIFIIYVLIGGDRGPAFTILLIIFFGHIILNNMSLKLKHIIIGVVFISFLSVVFTSVEILRMTDYEVLNKETLINVKSMYEIYEVKTGTQIRTTCLAIEGIDIGLYPHTYGQFFLQSIIKGIPFIGNYITNFLYDNSSIISGGSARLLTIQNSGLFYTSGLGTTYLADTYIDFGIIGVVFISLLYGFIVGIFDYRCRLNQFNNFSQFLLISIFIGYSVYTGRSSLWVFITSYIQIWILYLFVEVLIRPFKNNKIVCK